MGLRWPRGKVRRLHRSGGLGKRTRSRLVCVSVFSGSGGAELGGSFVVWV
jgi:hypothetical protein